AAQTLHLLSRRSKAPFLPLNCGAISPTLIERELFGHERGSVTGAQRRHKGYFERAHMATLSLDEITEMPIELEVKLLRVQGTAKLWTEDSLDRLRTHSWPGNVRELKNVVHRAFIMADNEITPRCLPREVGGESGSVRSLSFQVGASIEDVERRLIMATLDAYGGNKRKTADILGVSLKTLYNRLNTYRDGEGDIEE